MIKKFKKALYFVLIMAVIAVCATAVACTDEKTEEVTVTYVYGNGNEDYVATLTKGGKAVEPSNPVRDGYNFVCWTLLGEDTAYDFDTPVEQNIILTAKWEEKGGEIQDKTVRVRWDGGDSAEFVFDKPVVSNILVGTEVKFSLRISPYYVGEPTVKAGSVVLTPVNGKYTFTVSAAVTVRVSGLTREDMNISGSGREKNPFIIRNASQLKAFTDYVNSGDKTYSDAYVALDADIDMNGFGLTPIGTQSKQFTGVFDGRNHVVKNFTVESEDGTYGFFGVIAQGAVKNLIIETDITVETVEKQHYLIGGVVGYCISGDVIGCTYKGDIKVVSTIKPDESYKVYVGGISGFVQGYKTDYTGTVSYCNVVSDITSEGKEAVYTVGGIVGALHGSSEGTPAYVHNCVYSGNIGGKNIMSGGIVGYLRDRSSVTFCISYGTVHAQCDLQYVAAGAIAGVGDNETVIAYCASTAKTESLGEAHDYETSDLTGIIYEDAYSSVSSKKSVTIDSYYSETGIVNENGKDYSLDNFDDVSSLLGLDKTEWTFSDGKIVPLDNGEAKNISVTVNFGRELTMTGADGQPLTQETDNVIMTDYGPLYWIYETNGMNAFTADDGTVSYGFFFDSECKIRVPSCMLVTKDLTFYVGFADYSPVAGEFYTVIDGNELKLLFDDNGKLTVSAGAMVANYMYVYDGEKILIKDGDFAEFDSYFAKIGQQYGWSLTTDYYAEKSADGLVIYDIVFFQKDNQNLPAIKAVAGNAAMGVWYDDENAVYTFLADGTGKKVSADGLTTEGFTYICNGSSLTYNIGNTVIRATMDGDVISSATESFRISRFDAFRGGWESEYSTKTTIKFDGMGSVNYKDTEYEYTITEGKAVFGNLSAYFNDSGLLVLEDSANKTVFGMEGSFMGFWKENLLDYWMILNGITKDGYGTGIDSYGITFTYAPMVDGLIYRYYRTQYYGSFSVNISEKGEEMLYLDGFMPSSGMFVDDFNMGYIDPFEGTWNCGDGISYSFNGEGAYDIYYTSSEGLWQVQGFVTVTENGVDTEVRYYYNKATATATFNYKNAAFTARLDGKRITVNGNVCAAPDEISFYAYGNENIKLEFNGKATVNKGKATLTIGGTAEEYDYTVSDDGEVTTAALTKNGTVFYTFIIDGRGITLSGETDIPLGIYHALAGKKFIVGGIYIEIGYLNADGEGTAFLGEDTVSVYYVDNEFLSLYYGTEFLYYVKYHDENNALLTDGMGRVSGVITVPDGLEGVYRAENGDQITLDGTSNGGTVIIGGTEIPVDAEVEMTVDGETQVYVYTLIDGEYYVCEKADDGEGTVYEKIYKISLSAEENSVKYETEDGKIIYLTEVA